MKFKQILLKIILTLAYILIPAISLATALDEFNNKNFEQAKVLFEKQAKSAERSYYLGKIALKENDMDQAEDYFEDALEQEPTSAKYNYQFGAISFQQAANASIFSAMGYASDGKKYHLKALEIDPNYVPAMQGMIGFYSNAPSIAGGSIKKALAMARKLTKVDAMKGLISQINIYRADEKQDKEINLANELAEKFPGSAQALFVTGLSFQNAQKYPQAFTYFERSGQFESDDEKYYVLSAQYQTGRTAVISKTNTQKGIKALETYRLLAPEYYSSYQSLPSAHWSAYRLAALYYSSGNFVKAKAMVEAALQEKDDDSLIKNAKKLLKTIVKKLD